MVTLLNVTFQFLDLPFEDFVGINGLRSHDHQYKNNIHTTDSDLKPYHAAMNDLDIWEYNLET